MQRLAFSLAVRTARSSSRYIVPLHCRFFRSQIAALSKDKANYFDKLKNAIKELRGEPTAQTPKQATPAVDVAALMREHSAAESDDKDICMTIANALYTGASGERNIPLAIEYWRRAGELGDKNALYSIAMCARVGEGMEKDLGFAFSTLLSLADEHHNPMAHFAVGDMYSKGEGTEENQAKAFEHFNKAAKLGVIPALYNISNMLATGQGVERNTKKALMYLQAAAEVGDPKALFTLGTHYYAGNIVEQDKKKAMQFYVEAAQKGHAIAAYNVGVQFLEGEGASQDFKKALAWLETAAKMGFIEAKINIAYMYLEGKGVTKDLAKARALYAQVPESELSKQMIEKIDNGQV